MISLSLYRLGLSVGIVDGESVRLLVGPPEGTPDAVTEGIAVGDVLGSDVGAMVGSLANLCRFLGM